MLLDGAERSLTGARKQYATGLQIQVCTYPPPPFCFRFGALLSWVPVLAAFNTAPEPGLLCASKS